MTYSGGTIAGDNTVFVAPRGPAGGAFRSIPVVACTRCLNQRSNASSDAANSRKIRPMSWPAM